MLLSHLTLQRYETLLEDFRKTIFFFSVRTVDLGCWETQQEDFVSYSEILGFFLTLVLKTWLPSLHCAEPGEVSLCACLKDTCDYQISTCLRVFVYRFGQVGSFSVSCPPWFLNAQAKPVQMHTCTFILLFLEIGAFVVRRSGSSSTEQRELCQGELVSLVRLKSDIRHGRFAPCRPTKSETNFCKQEAYFIRYCLSCLLPLCQSSLIHCSFIGDLNELFSAALSMPEFVF